MGLSDVLPLTRTTSFRAYVSRLDNQLMQGTAGDCFSRNGNREVYLRHQPQPAARRRIVSASADRCAVLNFSSQVREGKLLSFDRIIVIQDRRLGPGCNLMIPNLRAYQYSAKI